jgi:hypothetical protein
VISKPNYLKNPSPGFNNIVAIYTNASGGAGNPQPSLSLTSYVYQNGAAWTSGVWVQGLQSGTTNIKYIIYAV